MNLPAVRLIVLVYLLLSFISSLSKTFEFLEKGSSLSVESLDVLVSPNGDFMAGFYPADVNAFSFAIWLTATTTKPTIVWMANRDNPVNGRGSKISLLDTGNLILSDAGLVLLWEANTFSTSPVRLILLNSGNLVISTLAHKTLWESFDFPTDTLLPEQTLRKGITLISSRSRTNHSSGFYKLYFDTDNVIRLVFDGPEVSSVYWPEPGSVSWGAGRTPYNDSRIASLSRLGYFDSSDNLKFYASDAGTETVLRRLTIDPDGNLRVYSLDKNTQSWFVSWQAFSKTCKIHGNCGPNSLCTYEVYSDGRRCSCMPGFRIKDPIDWFYGCEPQFVYPDNTSDIGYIQMPKVEAYGYDFDSFSTITFDLCRVKCTNSSKCKGFLMRYSSDENGIHQCWLKTRLMNGYRSPDFVGTLHMKVPKSILPYEHGEEIGLSCLAGTATLLLNRTYEATHENESLKILIWVACALGGMELISIPLVVCFLYPKKQKGNEATKDYFLAATGFKRFTYDELRKATRGFNQEIGRGGSGIVYKGKLSDQRIAAIKILNQVNQGEAEFLVEVSTLSRLNHMNLIQMWGYCAEGKHRLLVYEYMELGSLAENLACNDALDWEKRFEIALGTAKGLAYLHEECLEWILHCDIKPQNVLLDSNYQPKVADFGLSKLVDRGANDNMNFSMIRGTRGYMAPEWVFNLPITSKVDVYSYGTVVLEMLTGKCPDGIQAMEDAGLVENWKKRLRSMIEEDEENNASESWIGDIVDPSLGGRFEMKKLKVLVRLALKCVEDDKDARPTMSQVVNILQSLEDEVYNFSF